MITRCNHCGSKFEVSDEVVYSNDPEVRCGECMSTFDAHANLFDEAEHRKASTTLKPVQKKIPTEKALGEDALKQNADSSMDQEAFETAETVAVEHIYTSAGVHARVVHAESTHAESFQANSVGGSDSYDSPTAELENDERPAYRPTYPVDNSYSAEFEFERTQATETALSDSAGVEDPIYRNDARPASPESLSLEPMSRESASDEQDIADKRQLLREREQRALQIEPQRDYQSPNDIDIDLDSNHSDQYQAARNLSDHDDGRDDLAQQHETARARISDSDLARDGDVGSSGDSHFIPEDVLKQSGVVRDNGRRSDEAIQFKSDTPQFDRSLNDEYQRSDSGMVTKTTDVAINVNEQRSEELSRRSSQNFVEQSAEARDISARQDRRSTEFESYREAPSAEPQRRQELDNYPAVPYEEHRDFDRTSAQEMRSYQRRRSPLQFTRIEDDVMDYDLVEAETETVTDLPRSKAGAAFWMVGLFLAIGLLLFAARGIVAGMNLPEPFLSAFCQITGCVPAQAKKDVSQLQTLRKQLYPHPEIENALVISVDVVNNSTFKQPMPTLGVSLMNAQSQLVAERDFLNTDYEMVDGSESGFLMPDEPTRLMIELVDTGLAATEVNLVFK